MLQSSSAWLKNAEVSCRTSAIRNAVRTYAVDEQTGRVIDRSYAVGSNVIPPRQPLPGALLQRQWEPSALR